MRVTSLGVLLILLLLLAVPAAVFAGTATERARELAAEGKLDEAEKALDAAIPGLAGKDRRDARRLRADVTARRPEREAFETARKLLAELASEDEEDAESRWILYELVWSRGERLVEASKKVEDPAPLLREARDTFAEASKLLEAEWKVLEEKGTDAAETAMTACGFYWPRCLAAQSRLEGDHALLVKAVDVWMRYSERCGGRPEAYEAAIDLAEALVELRRPDDALAAAESGVSIEEAAGGPLKGALLEIFERASLVKARILLGKNDAKKALAACERALAAVKPDDRSPLASLLRAERADAWAREGKQKEALAELERLASNDPTGPVGDLALQKIARITSSPAAGVSSDRALKHMNEALERKQASLALSHARSALSAARVEGKKESELAALEGVGRSLEAQRRVLEARVAYEEVAGSAKAPADLAMRSALGAVRCAEVERARDPGAHANGVCERTLALLEKRDPRARKGLAPFLLAKQLQDQSRFAEAARSYDQVSAESGEIHDESLYAGACCRFMDAKGKAEALAEVEKRLVLLLARPKTGLHEQAKNLLAEVLLQTNRPERVASLLEGATEPGLQYRAIAHVRLGQLDQAESLVATLLDRRSQDRRTATACRELAVALGKKSVALPDRERRGARARLARYFAAWLEEATGPQSIAIGQETFVLALDVLELSEKGAFVVELDGDPSPSAAPLLEVSIRAFDRALAAPTSRGAAPDRWKLLACRAQGIAFVGSWKDAAAAFDTLIAEAHVFSAPDELDRAVLARNPLLVGYLADLGVSELRAGATDAGRNHLAHVLATATEGSKLWWLARLAILKDAERRGTKESVEELKLSLKALARKYPEFGAAKELAAKFVEMAKKYVK